MMAYRTVMRTHVGLVRKVNEDAVLARSDIGLWAVADGMGGHDAGDFASRSIVERLSRLARPEDGQTLLSAVRDALGEVNLMLWQEAHRRISSSMIGSTVVVLLAHGSGYACLWAGDSRAYLLSRGTLRQLTRDHSLVQQLVEVGAISEEAAHSHPDGNVVTRAVGAAPSLQLDLIEGPILEGDLLLLCSDGLTKLVLNDELAAVLERCELSEAVDALLQLCLDRGARDNVSLILVRAEAETGASPDDGEEDTLGSTAPGSPPASPERRAHPRHMIGMDGLLRHRAGAVRCRVLNASHDAFLVEVEDSGAVNGDGLVLELDGVGSEAVTFAGRRGNQLVLASRSMAGEP